MIGIGDPMQLTPNEVIAVILALVSALLFLFRQMQDTSKKNGVVFEQRYQEQKKKLETCEIGHKETNEKLFDLGGKVQYLMGKRDAVEEMADRVIKEIKK
ncbi:MAG: hypothetical protein COA78_06915 [Blastopirellula sp.]|nr:MAG: hypothetical protein COA78_06915 [Blastopirellula sp.]